MCSSFSIVISVLHKGDFGLKRSENNKRMKYFLFGTTGTHVYVMTWFLAFQKLVVIFFDLDGHKAQTFLELGS